MLRSGMLWYDDTSGRSLAKKIERATQYYEQKYGQVPNICYVPTEELSQNLSLDNGLTVRPAEDLLPKHLWLGCA